MYSLKSNDPLPSMSIKSNTPSVKIDVGSSMIEKMEREAKKKIEIAKERGTRRKKKKKR